MGDQAEASLKIWESFLTEDVSKLRSLAHGGYSVGDSGTLRLVKSVCKSVSERGCEKSGRMVHFATFLKEKYDLNGIPLYPFLGYRFNIILLLSWFDTKVGYWTITEKDGDGKNSFKYVITLQNYVKEI